MNAFEKAIGLDKVQDRVIHRFSVPDSIPGEVRSVGMVKMSAEEELRVEQRCKGASDKRAQEMTKQSLVEVNGQAVSTADASADKAWATMHPKVRTLLTTAWVKLHLAEDTEVDSFFASRTSSV